VTGTTGGGHGPGAGEGHRGKGRHGAGHGGGPGSGRGGHGGAFEPEDGRRVPYSHEEPLACPIGEEKGKEHVWDDPGNVKLLLRIFYVVCAILILVDFVFHRHAVHPIEHWWGFYPLYGFVACVTLVLVAKEMRKVLMRDPDYYDGGE